MPTHDGKGVKDDSEGGKVALIGGAALQTLAQDRLHDEGIGDKLLSNVGHFDRVAVVEPLVVTEVLLGNPVCILEDAGQDGQLQRLLFRSEVAALTALEALDASV